MIVELYFFPSRWVDVFIQYVYVPVNVRAMDKIPTENTYIIYIFQKA